jgi:hypothetical protein
MKFFFKFIRKSEAIIDTIELKDKDGAFLYKKGDK